MGLSWFAASAGQLQSQHQGELGGLHWELAWQTPWTGGEVRYCSALPLPTPVVPASPLATCGWSPATCMARCHCKMHQGPHLSLSASHPLSLSLSLSASPRMPPTSAHDAPETRPGGDCTDMQEQPYLACEGCPRRQPPPAAAAVQVLPGTTPAVVDAAAHMQLQSMHTYDYHILYSETYQDLLMLMRGRDVGEQARSEMGGWRGGGGRPPSSICAALATPLEHRH